VRAISIMNMCLSLVSSIRPSCRSLDVISSNGFEKLIEVSLWGLCTVIADFENICVGRVCQESEDLSVPLSISCLCVHVLHLIFDYFCHIVVRSLFRVSTMSKVR